MLKQKNTLPAVLITGCSSGAGHASALRFVKSGYPTYASARRLESIRDLAEAGCHILQLDVTDQNSINKAVKTIEQERGSVGILINNAAIGIMTPIETIPIDEVRRQYETNIFGLLAVTQAVLPGMRKACKGRIVNMGSSGGEFTTPGGGVYQATKYALCSMNEAMRMELKPFGIDVTMLQPGAIASKFAVNGAVLGTDIEPYKQLMRGINQVTSEAVKPKAPGTWSPEQIAEVIFKAGTKRKPKARYRPGFVAKSLIYLKLWLPYRVWDKMFMNWLVKEGEKQM
jgi:NADP-dependent 3-hydroxy acid dehydrogenase YdfG